MPTPVTLLDPADYRFVREGFRELLPCGAAVEPRLRAVVETTLEHPGSLVRAQVAFSAVRGRGVDRERARNVAIGIEYLHTASLILDDLPSMDDATYRRGHLCAHVAQGESAAILGALAFINAGYALLWKVLGTIPENARLRAGRLVEGCLGLHGILDGQARDLHFDEGPRDADAVLRIAEGKTVTLVRLTLLLPAIVGNASDAELDRLETLSRAWGLSYQILDDFKDRLMTRAETAKSTGRDRVLDRPNFIARAGAESALRRLDRFLACARGELNRLQDGSRPTLERLQGVLQRECDRVRERLTAARCA